MILFLVKFCVSSFQFKKILMYGKFGVQVKVFPNQKYPKLSDAKILISNSTTEIGTPAEGKK